MEDEEGSAPAPTVEDEEGSAPAPTVEDEEGSAPAPTVEDEEGSESVPTVEDEEGSVLCGAGTGGSAVPRRFTKVGASPVPYFQPSVSPSLTRAVDAPTLLEASVCDPFGARKYDQKFPLSQFRQLWSAAQPFAAMRHTAAPSPLNPYVSGWYPARFSNSRPEIESSGKSTTTVVTSFPLSTMIAARCNEAADACVADHGPATHANTAKSSVLRKRIVMASSSPERTQ